MADFTWAIVLILIHTRNILQSRKRKVKKKDRAIRKVLKMATCHLLSFKFVLHFATIVIQVRETAKQ
jgi:hypothetical protein